MVAQATAVACGIMVSLAVLLLGIVGYGRHEHARSLTAIGVAYIPFAGAIVAVAYWMYGVGVPSTGAEAITWLMAIAGIVGLAYYFSGIYKHLN